MPVNSISDTTKVNAHHIYYSRLGNTRPCIAYKDIRLPWNSGQDNQGKAKKMI